MRLVPVLFMLCSGAALAAPTLTAPATAGVGSTITIQVSGGGAPRDFVSIVEKGAAAGRYRNYFYLEGKERDLVVPTEPGDYEIRLLGAASPYPTLATRPLKVTPVSATVKGPASAAAGTEISVAWTGPNNARDYVGIGEPNGRAYL